MKTKQFTALVMMLSCCLGSYGQDPHVSALGLMSNGKKDGVLVRPVLPDNLERLDVMTGGYPRAFYFRISELFARHLDFTTWESLFNRTDGMIGNVFDEVIPGTVGRDRLPEKFTTFKRMHPEQLVIAHYNGNARDPREDTSERFFDGHWLYFNGCEITDALPAQEGEMWIPVEDPDLFKLNYGRYGNKGEDLGICRLERGGKPDWSVAEQVELLDIDPEARKLKIRRGVLGTTARAWKSGQAYIAAHVTEGPWDGEDHNLMWFYNFSTTCPKDETGRDCNDILSSIVAERFNPGGMTEQFDGLEFDVMHWNTWPTIGKRGADCDADGQPDAGYVNGFNAYGAGMVQFCKKLREKLDDDKLMMADGNYFDFQRSFGWLNGLESEGWPNAFDLNFRCFSSGMNRHLFWNRRSAKPTFSFVAQKFKSPPWSLLPDGVKYVPFDYRRTRLVMASCQMMDAVFSTATWPETDRSYQFEIEKRKRKVVVPGMFDELNMGKANRFNWLGQPLGGPIDLACDPSHVEQGILPSLSSGSLKTLQELNPGVAFAAKDGNLVARSRDKTAKGFRIVFPQAQLPSRDLTVQLAVRGDPMAGYPDTVARRLYLNAVVPGWLMFQSPEELGLMDGRNRTGWFDPASGGRFKNVGESSRYGESHAAYRVETPTDERSIFWKETVMVPKGASLKVWTALQKEKPTTFCVMVRDGNRMEELFEETHTSRHWREHTIALSPFAMRRVELFFVTSSDGAKSSMAFWGDAQLSVDDRVFDSASASAPLLSWFDTEWFEPSFYFRATGPGPVRLVAEVESGEAVVFKDLQAYAHPTLMAREFEHGVVLANPSNQARAFDLATLLPGKRFKRIDGEADPLTNNGQAVGPTVDVPPRDGLFLIREYDELISDPDKRGNTT